MKENMKQEYPLLHKIGAVLFAAADRVTAFAHRVEMISGKIPEIIVLFVYTAAHLGMAIVHEPFFDEAEAWQIARSVSLRTLFLETTHYEGHPPLWHLILMPLAKAGAPYELSLTLVSLLFMGTAVFLILRYAPFLRLVRLLLPFTYFFFYQYGVISRVYCVMTLAFVLLAMTYRRRNEQPGRYVAALILLCMTMAYGLILAGGLAIVWLWEIVNENWRKQEERSGKEAISQRKQESRDSQDNCSGGQKVRELLRGCAADRRIWWLAALLLAALGVIWMIVPRADTFAVAQAKLETVSNSLPVRLIYTFLVLPADAVLTDIYCDYAILPRASLPFSALASGAVVGLLIWSLFLYYGRKRHTTFLLVLPYSLFAFFSAVVYMSIHHIGIALLYFVFWCWASTQMAPQAEGGEGACPQEASTENGEQELSAARERVVRCAAILLGTLAMSVSLIWTGAACVLDIYKNYAAGRNEAAFIREHHLDRYRMMAGWLIEYDEAGNTIYADINECDLAVNLSPYFEHNLFFNFNDGKDSRNYITHIRFSEEETRRQYESWSKEEPPQVLWMSPDLSLVYGDAVRWQDYVLVYQKDAQQVWKAGAGYLMSSIWVRRDLLEETGLSPLHGRTENEREVDSGN